MRKLSKPAQRVPRLALMVLFSLAVVGPCGAGDGHKPQASDLGQRLIEAARTSQVGQVRQLLKAGAPVNSRDKKGATAVMWAACEGDLEVVQVLVEHGADVRASGCLVDAQPFTGRKEWFGTALHAAAGHGHLEVVRYLIEKQHVPVDFAEFSCAGIAKGCDANTPTMPLLEAAAGGYPAVVTYLLGHGASVDRRDECGDTPLIRAALASNPTTVGILLANGADPNARDRFGRTPLHAAAYYGRSADEVRLLVHAGATLDARDKDGDTPLHMAVLANSRPVVEALVAAGADLGVKNDRGDTPADVARNVDLPTLAKLVKEKKAPKAEPGLEPELKPAPGAEEDSKFAKIFDEAAKDVSDKELEDARRTLDPDGSMTDEGLRKLIAVQGVLGGRTTGADAKKAAKTALASLTSPTGLRTEPSRDSLDLRWDFQTQRIIGYSLQTDMSGTGLFRMLAAPSRAVIAVHARGDGTADVVTKVAPAAGKGDQGSDSQSFLGLFKALRSAMSGLAGDRVQQGFQEDSQFVEGTPSQRQTLLDYFPVIGQILVPGASTSVPRMFPFNAMGSQLLVKGTTEVRYVADLERGGRRFALIEARTDISKIDLPEGVHSPGTAWIRGRTFLVFDPEERVPVEVEGVLVTFMEAGIRTGATVHFSLHRIKDHN
ncbi:MAG: hypothetical protein GXP48_04600 [Acidobacteria bacterium]|nr:hypothetical protein [Acidobacteriota bacterium]